MKKRNLVLGLLVATMVSLAACGGKDGSASDSGSGSGSGTASKSKYAPVAEEDAVAYIGDVAVEMDMTWEAFRQLMKDNNWTINEKSDESDFPMGEDYMGNGFIDTQVGTIEFFFMDDKERNDSVLRAIEINPNTVDCDKINVCGITPYSDLEKVEKGLELINEHEYYKEFKLDDWMSITLYDPHLEEHGIRIERKQYQVRSLEEAFDLKQYMLETYPDFVYGEDMEISNPNATGEVVNFTDAMSLVIGDEWEIDSETNSLVTYRLKENEEDSKHFRMYVNRTMAYSSMHNLEYIEYLQRTMKQFVNQENVKISDIRVNGRQGYYIQQAIESKNNSDSTQIIINVDGYVYFLGCYYFEEQWENPAELEAYIEKAMQVFGTMTVTTAK